MPTIIFAVFCIVYLGMILGGLPFLQLDRTGIALLGAIALIGIGAVSPDEAAKSIHLPTLILLFSFMVVSAQMRLGGFYDWVTRRLAALPLPPPLLLAALTLVVAALSAVFSNDIVCLAVAPVLIDACLARRLDPVPYLLALACAANVGSAATLIGNPQNMLIGETLKLSFSGYFAQALLPVLLGLLVTWGLIAWQTRGRWSSPRKRCGARGGARAARGRGGPLDRWQTAKGLSVAAVLLAVFLFLPSWPRDVAALTGAGLLLTSRKLHSSKMLGLVDWELLILFIGLFVVNHALQQTGIVAGIVADFAAAGVNLGQPGPAVRRHACAVQHRLQRAGGDVAAPGRSARARRPDSGAGEHARGQPPDRRQHRKHHRGRRRGAARHPHRLAAPRARRRTGDPCHARDLRSLALVAPAAGGLIRRRAARLERDGVSRASRARANPGTGRGHFFGLSGRKLLADAR